MELPAITRVSRSVIRILGQNPGTYTLQGTNTYLVGEQNPYILIDTGEGRDEYIPILQGALQDPSHHVLTDKPHVSDIVLTHKHHDHCQGLPSVLHLLRQMWLDNPKTRSLPYNPPRIHKYPLSAPDGKLQSIVDSLSTLPNGSFSPDPSGKPIHDLYDAQKLPVTTTSPDSSRSILEILHTPGHTSDSICLYYPPDCSLFTADTVLGHGSSVFEVLGIYMASLRKIIAFGENGEKYGPVYPGHGPVVSNGLGQVTTYLKHRVARETQILEVIQKPPPSNRYWTTWSIVSSIYADYPRDLWEAAARSVDMHLHKLESDGLVEGQGGEGKHTEWNFIG